MLRILALFDGDISQTGPVYQRGRAQKGECKERVGGRGREGEGGRKRMGGCEGEVRGWEKEDGMERAGGIEGGAEGERETHRREALSESVHEGRFGPPERSHQGDARRVDGYVWYTRSEEPRVHRLVG